MHPKSVGQFTSRRRRSTHVDSARENMQLPTSGCTIMGQRSNSASVHGTPYFTWKASIRAKKTRSTVLLLLCNLEYTPPPLLHICATPRTQLDPGTVSATYDLDHLWRVLCSRPQHCSSLVHRPWGRKGKLGRTAGCDHSVAPTARYAGSGSPTE